MAKISEEAKAQIKEIWVDAGEDAVFVAVDNLIKTFDILANDTKSKVFQYVVAGLKAVQPLINEGIDLINGKEDL